MVTDCGQMTRSQSGTSDASCRIGASGSSGAGATWGAHINYSGASRSKCPRWFDWARTSRTGRSLGEGHGQITATRELVGEDAKAAARVAEVAAGYRVTRSPVVLGSFFWRIGRAACIVWPAPQFVRGPDARQGPGP